jgi:ribonuclease D
MLAMHGRMTTITTTEALADFCSRLEGADFIAIDTEFLRENTFWPKLCLVQVAGPDEAAAIDPLAPGIDLAPLDALVCDERILKVFHAGRQDIEIFLQRTGRVPAPLFDTQVAAMVCGFGDSVGYETLATKLAGARIDKSSRFTDWSRRPLTERQIDYAMADVVHLRPVYLALKRQLEKSGRAEWLREEMDDLADPSNYVSVPEDAWQRFKPRSTTPRFLNVLREVAAWREREAQARDLPRGWILKDEPVLEIAAHHPRDIEALARVRGLSRGSAEGWQGRGILEAVERGMALPPEAAPPLADRPMMPPGLAPVVDLLRVLLKLRCEENDVAQKLVASAGDLEAIAMDDDAAVPALHGWRRGIFGEDALALKQGRIAIGVQGRKTKLVRL